MMTRCIARLLVAGAWMLSGSLLSSLLGGCALFEASPPPIDLQQEPIAQQLVRKMPSLRTQRFSTLLDFELDTDAVFVAMQPPGRMVWDRSHTGRRSLFIPEGTERVAIKLSSVLSGRQFPGEWTLVGAFLYCDDPIDVTIGIDDGVGGADVSVSPRRVHLTRESWSIALADLSGSASSSVASIGDNTMLVITLPPNAPELWCDDVVLIDNSQTIVSTASPASATQAEEYTVTTHVGPATVSSTAAAVAPPGAGWLVQRRGLSYIGEAPGKFNFKLVTSDASRSGWRIEEANAIRARFTSDGQVKNLTVYSDGRAFKDGEWSPMSAAVRDYPDYLAAHQSPAEISVTDTLGRVNRDTPGDANNDGYNEQRGAHQIIATEARLELKIIPHTSSVTNPVLEVSGLPEGNVLITVEGRLVDRSERLPDGTLLVELPVRIDRPTIVNLRVQ
ncbi:MAG: hypothetical protein H7Z14_13580 [Anaerolineae bacterium]|nr:hypothetical protein [Phycisphaerae bacterium]